MATVPGILIIGDAQVQGGATFGVDSTTSSLGASQVQKFFDLALNRVTQSNETTGVPNAATLGWYPWFDRTEQSTFYSAASATSTTITANGSPGWTVNEWAGRPIVVFNATLVGFLNFTTVVSNTANTITVASWPGGTPGGGAIFRLGQGRWTDYHPAAGHVYIPTEVGVRLPRGGSCAASLGAGVGPDAGLIRQLFENTYTSAPYFQLAKFADPSKTVGAWGTAASAVRTLFETLHDDMDSAWTALANGDTLSWDLVIWDVSQADVVNWASAPANYLLYQAALEASIAYLRTELGNASLKVLLVCHDNAINNVTTPSGTLSANRIHRTIEEADSLVRTVSMQGLRTAGTTTYGTVSENRPYYAASEYWTNYATRVRQAYDRMLAGTPVASDGVIPTYLFIGDSICVGAFNATYTDALNSPTLTSTPRSAAQSIFNAVNAAGESYDVGDNSNTSGTISVNAGPECSMMVELEAIHPDGFLLIKRGSNSSSLIAQFASYAAGGTSGGRWSHSIGSEHWDALLDLFASAEAYAWGLGKQLDVKGIFVILGTNDGAKAGGGALFAAELATFVADMRAAFATRSSGADLPIVWRKPQLGYQTAISDEITTIRAALEAYALTDSQFALVNVDDLERLDSDNIHETGDSSITDGQRMVAAMSLIAI